MQKSKANPYLIGFHPDLWANPVHLGHTASCQWLCPRNQWLGHSLLRCFSDRIYQQWWVPCSFPVSFNTCTYHGHTLVSMDHDFPDVEVENCALGDLPEDQLGALEADCFWCFSKLLDGIQDNYTFAQPGIQLKVDALRHLISRIDSQWSFSPHSQFSLDLISN